MKYLKTYESFLNPEISSVVSEINDIPRPNAVYINCKQTEINIKGKASDAIEITEISVLRSQQNKGLATQVLKKATEIADEKKVILTLEAMPVFGEELSTEQLIEFYKKFDFKVTKHPIMVRIPK
jgi:ribosomal protein S18 acetylase RimI-like enzyme